MAILSMVFACSDDRDDKGGNTDTSSASDNHQRNNGVNVNNGVVNIDGIPITSSGIRFYGSPDFHLTMATVPVGSVFYGVLPFEYIDIAYKIRALNSQGTSVSGVLGGWPREYVADKNMNSNIFTLYHYADAHRIELPSELFFLKKAKDAGVGSIEFMADGLVSIGKLTTSVVQATASAEIPLHGKKYGITFRSESVAGGATDYIAVIENLTTSEADAIESEFAEFMSSSNAQAILINAEGRVLDGVEFRDYYYGLSGEVVQGTNTIHHLHAVFRSNDYRCDGTETLLVKFGGQVFQGGCHNH